MLVKRVQLINRKEKTILVRKITGILVYIERLKQGARQNKKDQQILNNTKTKTRYM